MKKCPKCKAEIEENARFCLYCMTSFEEKETIETIKENNKRWLYIIAALLAFLIFLVGIFIFGNKNPNNNKKDTSSSLPITNNSIITGNENTITNEQNNDISQSNKNSNSNSINEPQTPSNSEGNGTNQPSNNETTSNSSTSTSNNNNTEDDNSGNTSSTDTITNESKAVTYIYRDAKYGDDFSVNANLENSVVITGVKTAATNGKYIIPETLDGKKVIAIMPLAFCEDNISNTVKTVVLPSSVKTIWNNAFANCYNLTDIYFKGNSIYTEAYAFAETSKRNGTLTIHCSANCSDRNYRYYKNSASNYNAKYAEWNG
ncbi:MAG: leucine-rich repeat protein [Clostridia bacterium]|nr:leucine-rich repeat protein [Clostridia bacterium]